jgi:hypothetical protein
MQSFPWSSGGAQGRGINILVKVDSSVGELSEGSLLLELGGLLSVLSTRHKSVKFHIRFALSASGGG